MAIIVIDIGNTNTKFAVCTEGSILKKWTVSTCVNRTSAEYFAILSTLASQNNIDIKSFSEAVVSSVVPMSNRAIKELCTDFFHISPRFIRDSDAASCGISIDLAQKALGADRLADLVAARQLWPERNLLVIDMGTITVFNLLNKSGSVYGQLLAPGVSCLTESIRSKARLLPQACPKETKKAVAYCIVTSLESGLYWGYRSMVSGIIEQILHEENGKDIHVVATGGGSRFLSGCPYIHDTDSLLTIKGLLSICNYLKKASA